ncbi:Uncharacterised protein [Vibrio cholerae]|uniref:Uncharacterized protein n=1 Tax=Vibrio cholerae TaxID=666 RepID=A0A655TCT2_VIBCL|nr:Uncharacterised protein [Vibrio cholerae]CSC21133.1 Uncharacterised protein [Vibrio cholerae]
MEAHRTNTANTEHIKAVGLVVVKNVRINVGTAYDSRTVNTVARTLCTVLSYLCTRNRIIRFVVRHLSHCVDGCTYRQTYRNPSNSSRS